MSDFEGVMNPSGSPEQLAVQVGEPLAGLVVDVSHLPEGTHYWDQIVPSVFGELYYSPEQWRDGTIRWVTNHGEVRIVVEGGTGRVLEVDEDARDKHSKFYSDEFEKGMAGYKERRAIGRLSLPRSTYWP